MNILVISAAKCGLFEPKSGGSNRFYNLTRQLIKKGNKVIVVQPSKYKHLLDDSLTEVHYFRFHIGNKTFGAVSDFNINFAIKVIKILKKEKIDVIQVSFPRGIILLKLITKLLRKKIPIVYDAHNVQYDVRFIKHSKRSFLEKLFVLKYVPLQERIAVRCADHIITVSREDKLRFIEKYKVNEAKITIIPSGVNMINIESLKDRNGIKKEFCIDSDKLLVIFHGSYCHFPNREAIDLIINYIAPKIVKVNKEVLFIIGGLDVSIFEKNNVVSVGFIEDIYSLIHAADMAIVPILKGGGTRLKILDYMGVGLPIVTTKKGIEGINAKNGEHAIIVDDINEEFINAIKYLIDNEQERKRIGANARKLAEEEYDWENIGKKLDKSYKTILEEIKRQNEV